MLRLSIFLLGLVLCGTPGHAEPLTIRVGWSTMPGHMIPVLFSKSELLKHYGKTYVVQPIAFRGSSPQITAMAAREVDLVAYSPATLALTVLNARLDTKVLADMLQDGIPGYHSEMFLVRTDSGIASVAELKGKRVGTNAVGSASDTAMRAMLKRARLSDPRDFTSIEAAFPSLPALLESKKVDMSVVLLPKVLDLVKSGRYRTLFTAADAWGPSQLVFLAGRADFVAKNHDAMMDFMEDYVRAWRWFLDPANHEAAVKIVADYMKQPASDLQYLFTKDDYYRDPFMRANVPALQSAIDTSKELGVIPGTIDVAPRYVDDSFVAEAKKRIEAAP